MTDVQQESGFRNSLIRVGVFHRRAAVIGDPSNS